MYTMERRLEMTLPVQTNLNTSIGSTRLVTFTEHTVNTYLFQLLLPNRGKMHCSHYKRFKMLGLFGLLLHFSNEMTFAFNRYYCTSLYMNVSIGSFIVT